MGEMAQLALRIFDEFFLADAQVTLIPEDIPRKRRWIWRLPIGIKLVDPASVAMYIEDLRAEAAKQDEDDKKKNKFDDKVSAKRLHWGDPPSCTCYLAVTARRKTGTGDSRGPLASTQCQK